MAVTDAYTKYFSHYGRVIEVKLHDGWLSYSSLLIFDTYETLTSSEYGFVEFSRQKVRIHPTPNSNIFLMI